MNTLDGLIAKQGALLDRIISKGLYSRELNRLTTSKVLGITTINGYIEIKYLKNNAIGYLTLTYSSKPNHHLTTRECNFKFGDEELPQTMLDAQDLIYDGTETIYTKETHSQLHEIVYIHNTNYNLLYHYDPDEQCQEITITANTKNGKLKKYILGFESNDDGIRVSMSVTSHEISGVFISKALDEQNLVISSRFDDKYIFTHEVIDTVRENGDISRLYRPNWTDVYQENKNIPIELKEKEDYFSITGVGAAILDKKHFELFEDEDKQRFFTYANELVAHLKALFINKQFGFSKKYTYTNDDDFEAFLESLKQKGYEVETVYTQESGNGWPPYLYIYKATKDTIELKITVYYECGLEEYDVDVESDSELLL